VRAETDEFEAGLVRHAVDQDQIGPDVAVAVIAPLAAERVIKITSGQPIVLRQMFTAFSNSASRYLLRRPAFSRL
jgi:hypothetical protein